MIRAPCDGTDAGLAPRPILGSSPRMTVEQEGWRRAKRRSRRTGAYPAFFSIFTRSFPCPAGFGDPGHRPSLATAPSRSR